MHKRSLLFGAAACVVGFAPTASVYANAGCEAVALDALVTPLATVIASPLMSALVDSDTVVWHMPAGRYWISMEVSDALLTQEGIGIPDETIESWLLAPAESLAVPF